MKNTADKPNQRIYRPRNISIRGSVLLILGGFVGGIAAATSYYKNSNHLEVVGSAKENGSAVLSGNDDVWPPNLVSEVCFDKNPIDYVDVDQCRDLIVKITQGSVAVGEEEILRQADEIRRIRNEWSEAFDKLVNSQKPSESEVDKVTISARSKQNIRKVVPHLELISNFDANKTLHEARNYGFEDSFEGMVQQYNELKSSILDFSGKMLTAHSYGEVRRLKKQLSEKILEIIREHRGTIDQEVIDLISNDARYASNLDLNIWNRDSDFAKFQSEVADIMGRLY